MPSLLLGTAAFAALGLLVAGTLRAEATLAAANLVYLLLLVGGAVVVPRDGVRRCRGLAPVLPSAALGDAMRAAMIESTVAWSALGVLAAWAWREPARLEVLPMGVIEALPRARTWLWPLAVANLVANIGSWSPAVPCGSPAPASAARRCRGARTSPTSRTPSSGCTASIEFGNRMLTWVLAAIAVACWLRPGDPAPGAPRGSRCRAALGVPGAGRDRRHDSAHRPQPLDRRRPPAGLDGDRRLSACCCWTRCGDPIDPTSALRVKRLGWLVLGAGWLVLYLGTVVTGSGPHAGDQDAHATGSTCT